MPERFDIAVPMETADEEIIRSDLFNRLRAPLARWFGPPREMMLLGPERDEHGPWTDGMSIADYALKDDDQLFVYCGIPGHEGHAVFGVMRAEQTAVYGLSFPTHVQAGHMTEIPAILLDIYGEIAALNIRGIVAAGNELSIFPDICSVEGVIALVAEVGSLIELVCCSADVAAELAGFDLIERRSGASVYQPR